METSASLTVPNRFEKLHRAIDLADQAGHCQYTMGGYGANNPVAPCCVIGQLYVLEGGDVLDLQNCEGDAVIDSPLLSEFFRDKYDLEMLQGLQKLWDRPVRSDILNVMKLREKMHELVNEKAEHPGTLPRITYIKKT